MHRPTEKYLAYTARKFCRPIYRNATTKCDGTLAVKGAACRSTLPFVTCELLHQPALTTEAHQTKVPANKHAKQIAAKYISPYGSGVTLTSSKFTFSSCASSSKRAKNVARPRLPLCLPDNSDDMPHCSHIKRDNMLKRTRLRCAIFLLDIGDNRHVRSAPRSRRVKKMWRLVSMDLSHFRRAFCF